MPTWQVPNPSLSTLSEAALWKNVGFAIPAVGPLSCTQAGVLAIRTRLGCRLAGALAIRTRLVCGRSGGARVENEAGLRLRQATRTRLGCNAETSARWVGGGCDARWRRSPRAKAGMRIRKRVPQGAEAATGAKELGAVQQLPLTAEGSLSSHGAWSRDGAHDEDESCRSRKVVPAHVELVPRTIYKHADGENIVAEKDEEAARRTYNSQLTEDTISPVSLKLFGSSWGIRNVMVCVLCLLAYLHFLFWWNRELIINVNRVE